MYPQASADNATTNKTPSVTWLGPDWIELDRNMFGSHPVYLRTNHITEIRFDDNEMRTATIYTSTGGKFNLSANDAAGLLRSFSEQTSAKRLSAQESEETSVQVGFLARGRKLLEQLFRSFGKRISGHGLLPSPRNPLEHPRRIFRCV
jgi:hypothetical protein